MDSLLNDATVPATVAAFGDLAYERGTAGTFARCYQPTWGRFKSLTRPVPGNHDYMNGFLWFLFGGHADPYFDYFDSFPGQAGDPGDGWYRYSVGSWDVYALNSGKDGKIKPDSRQWNWLEDELRLNPARCSLVYVHNPRFSTGKHRDNEKMWDVWDLLARNGVDVWLSGHDHNYQRFHPQTADGVRNASGIRQFIVGTGGTYLYTQTRETAGQLDRRTSEHHGVIKLVLRPDGYDWEFIVGDGVVWDSGSSSCQNTAGG
jgi:hypothetical protein